MVDSEVKQGSLLLPHIRFFLTSPGDVSEERTIARTFLQQLSMDPFVRDRATIELVAWDSDGAGAPMLAARTPQASIDAGLPRPSECEVVVAVFWGRIGTPLPHPEYSRPDGSPYQSGSVWELEDALFASRRTGHPKVLIYRRTPPPSIDPSGADADYRFSQFRSLNSYFDSFRDPDTGSILTAFAEFKEPDEFRRKIENDLKTLTRDLTKDPDRAVLPRKDARSGEAWHGSPFPGLRSFTPADVPIFFGRGRETDLLTARVKTSEFVTVIGASGSGKSSLVGAGLIPRLADDVGAGSWLLPSFDPKTRRWAGLRFTPGEFGPDPFLSLADKLAPFTGDQPYRLAAQLAARPIDITEVLGTAIDVAGTGRALLFVDQFEELFTVVDAAHREGFVRLLKTVADGGTHRVVATLRSDLYHRCLEYQTLARLLEDGQVPVAAPSDTLPEMISGPAGMAGLTLDEGLVGRLLGDTGSDAGALPLLAFALDELYRLSEGRMTISDYERLGGVQGAIGARAEEIFQHRLGDAERDAFAAVFRDLVEVGDDGRAARRRALMASLDARPECGLLVGAFTDARLLVSSAGGGGTPMVEVAHEALFQSWPRLRDFIERQGDDLRLLRVVARAARDWDQNGRTESYLWPHERLQPVYEMLRHLRPTVDGVTEAFIRPEHERLLSVLSGESTPEYQRAATADRLAIIGDPAVPGLARLLENPDERVRTAAATALGRIGSPALPAVSEVATAGAWPEWRLSAVGALAGMAGGVSSDALAAVMRDPDRRVRSAAIGALRSRTLTPATEKALLQALSDTDIDVRWEAVGTLAAFGSLSVPGLVNTLGGDSSEAVDAATQALLGLGSLAVPVLVANLGTGAAAARQRVAKVLVGIGPAAADSVASTPSSPTLDEEWRMVSVLGALGDQCGTERICLALRSGDSDVRSVAVSALGELGDPKAIERLLPLLDDAEVDVRDLAAIALAKLGSDAVDPVADLLRSSRSAGVRRACRMALSRIGAAAVPRLMRDLETSEHRDQVELVLANCGSPAVPPLVSALGSARPEVVQAVQRVLVEIGSAALSVLLSSLRRREWNGFVPALDVLATLTTDLGSAHILLAGLTDAEPEVRRISIRGLAGLGDSVVPMLTTRLSADDPTLRSSVVSVFTAIGGPGVPTLMERARNGHFAEREAAKEALEQIMAPAAVFYTYQRIWATQVATEPTSSSLVEHHGGGEGRSIR